MVILFDQYNLPNDIYEVIFATQQQAIVAKLLIDELKIHGGIMGKTEMSLFANKLHDGTIVEVPPVSQFSKKETVQLSYNKRQFYDRILTPMKSMGLIEYDLYKKQYRISTNFPKILMKVGVMWSQEVNRTRNVP